MHYTDATLVLRMNAEYRKEITQHEKNLLFVGKVALLTDIREGFCVYQRWVHIYMEQYREKTICVLGSTLRQEYCVIFVASSRKKRIHAYHLAFQTHDYGEFVTG